MIQGERQSPAVGISRGNGVGRLEGCLLVGGTKRKKVVHGENAGGESRKKGSMVG